MVQVLSLCMPSGASLVLMAWGVQECVKVRKSVEECAKLCQKCAKVCLWQSVARLCKLLQDCARPAQCPGPSSQQIGYEPAFVFSNVVSSLYHYICCQKI